MNKWERENVKRETFKKTTQAKVFMNIVRIQEAADVQERTGFFFG